MFTIPRSTFSFSGGLISRTLHLSEGLAAVLEVSALMDTTRESWCVPYVSGKLSLYCVYVDVWSVVNLHVPVYSGISTTVEPLNNVTFGTSYSVHYREVPFFGGFNCVSTIGK